MTDEPDLLLDTCAIIFIALDSAMKPDATDAISIALEEGRVRVSAMSAWEIGLAMAKGRLKSPLLPLEFFSRFVRRLGTDPCALSPELLIDSSYLPGSPQGDPADRILMATARGLDMILVTRDRQILEYGKAGYLRTLEC